MITRRRFIRYAGFLILSLLLSAVLSEMISVLEARIAEVICTTVVVSSFAIFASKFLLTTDSSPNVNLPLHHPRMMDDMQHLANTYQYYQAYFAALSNELRTPLTAILGFSQVILKNNDQAYGSLTDHVKRDLQTIHESGKRLLNIINDYIDQARIDTGKFQMDTEYYDLMFITTQVINFAERLIKGRPISLHVELEPNLPPAFGDKYRTRQILMNLISSAFQYTTKGTITLSARTIHEDNRVMIEISVKGTGLVIPGDDIEKLFDSLESLRLNPSDTTRLALPLAKSITELQGGRIWVENEAGTGSSFNITIPTEPVQVVKPEQVESSTS